MVRLTGVALVEHALMGLTPDIPDEKREAWDRGVAGARRFCSMVQWSADPRVLVEERMHLPQVLWSKLGDGLVSMVFINEEAVSYRAATGRMGKDFIARIKGTDTHLHALQMVLAFGVNVLTLA